GNRTALCARPIHAVRCHAENKPKCGREAVFEGHDRMTRQTCKKSARRFIVEATSGNGVGGADPHKTESNGGDWIAREERERRHQVNEQSVASLDQRGEQLFPRFAICCAESLPRLLKTAIEHGRRAVIEGMGDGRASATPN